MLGESVLESVFSSECASFPHTHPLTHSPTHYPCTVQDLIAGGINPAAAELAAIEEQKKKDGAILTAIVHFYDGYEDDKPPVQALHSLVTHPWFDLLITLFIILNTFALMAEYEGQSQTEQDILKIFNYVFTFM